MKAYFEDMGSFWELHLEPEKDQIGRIREGDTEVLKQFMRFIEKKKTIINTGKVIRETGRGNIFRVE